MSNQINKALILALGIAIGVIAMLLIDRKETPSQHQSTGAIPSTSVLPEVVQPTSPTAQPPRLTAVATDAQAITEEDTAAFEEEMQRVLRGQATDDEQLAFWQGIQTSKRLDALIATLQETTKADSEDVTSRLSLAQAYITKLWGTPSGPAQGLWAGKAEVLWREVLEADAENWDAQRNIAFSYSQYPDFLNKTGTAIAEYEKTIALQEAAPEPRSRFANSYLDLAKLHVKNGDPSNALAILEKGVAAHPEDNALAEQLQVISSSYKFEEPAPE